MFKGGKMRTIIESSAKVIKLVTTLVFLGLWCISHANAAKLELLTDHPMDCKVNLEGLIEEGDTERLLSILQSLPYTYKPQYVCLNSPGGSYLEGVRMAEAIYKNKLGTAVPENSRCESACAIAFLAGSYFNPEGELATVDRKIHPSSKLGFHAPGLIIPEGEFTKKQVDAAYLIALKAVTELSLLRIKGIKVPDTLFTRILDTPFDSMFYIDDVNLALRYDITVVDVDFYPGDITASLTNMCYNAVDTIDDIDFARSQTVYDAQEFPFEISKSTPYENQNTSVYKLFGGAFYEEASYSCVIETTLYGDYIGAWTVNFGDPNNPAKYRPSSKTRTYSLASWPANTKLQNLDDNRGLTPKEFLLNAVATLEQPPKACAFDQLKLRIDNVQNFTNFRQQPGLRANIIGKITLGEVVTAVVPGRYLRTERCASACEGTNQEAINRCIDNNEVWIEVRHNGSRGYLSRKFLSASD